VSYSDKFQRAFKFSILGWECVFAKGHYGDPAFVIAENGIAAINSAGAEQLPALLAKRDDYYRARGPWADKFRKGWLDRNQSLKRELGFA
jgi:hypothetical protein